MTIFMFVLIICLSTGSNAEHLISQSNEQTSYWYASVLHNGISPYINNGAAWPVFRNVKDYGAAGDGVTDDTAAIQKAINYGNSDGDRSQNVFGTTGQPAVVYFPQGTYILTSPIQLFLYTVMMGDPTSMPSIKASSNFNGDTLLYGKDPHYPSTDNFYVTVKNLILDSTSLPGSKSFTLLDWSVSQATQLTNVIFRMPNYSTGHTGLHMPEGGSGTYLGDLQFYGGVVGLDMANQQYMIKNVLFDACTTGAKISGCFDCVFQGCTFTNVQTGIDMTPGSNIGSVVVIDSKGSNLYTLISTVNTGTGARSLILENVQNTGTVTVIASGATILTGSVDTWYMGNEYLPGGPAYGQHTSGTSTTTQRSQVLLDSNGNYFTMPPPTYQDYNLSRVVNVKAVSGLPVYGDGRSDDTQNINTILQNSIGKILYFPAGTYLLSSTVFVPSGTRIVGEVWSAFSATGSYFSDENDPKPMIKVGEPGDKGVAQFSDVLFTVADILPGCKLLEVNMAGNSPGDVGFWNCHFRIGGARGSMVETNCGGSAGNCKAAYLMLHLTPQSSAYIEDMWGWTADHDLDSNNGQTISTGRGCLVESTAGTWFVGTAFEHNTLYQYNFNNAQNVYAGMMQCETPYWQGPNNILTPAPWTVNSTIGDPDFSNCAGGDGQCRMAWFQIIHGCQNLYLHGGGFWTFFNNNNGACGGSTCQTNAVSLENSFKVYIYGLNARANTNLVVGDNGGLVVSQYNNPGGWGGVVAAMLANSN